MSSASRSDRRAWADAAYDVAWRILHDRDAAIATAIHGLQIEAIADPASAVLIETRRRALELLTEHERPRTATDESAGVAFVHDSDSLTDAIHAADHAWGAAEAMGPEDASLIDLHLRFGVPAGTLADAVGTEPEKAAEQLARLRGRLEGALATWRIWHEGRPRCDALAELIDEAGISSFGTDTGRTIAKHAVGCAICRAAMTDGSGSGLDDFVRAPVLQAPAEVAETVPISSTRSVFAVEDQPPAWNLVPTDEPDDDIDQDDDRDRAPTNDISGPGVFAGIALGVVIALLIIAVVAAWVLTSG